MDKTDFSAVLQSSIAGFSKCDRGASPRRFRPMYAFANMGHPSCFNGFQLVVDDLKAYSVQIDAEEGQGALVGGVCDVGAKNMALAGIDLDFAGEVPELAEAD